MVSPLLNGNPLAARDSASKLNAKCKINDPRLGGHNRGVRYNDPRSGGHNVFWRELRIKGVMKYFFVNLRGL